MSQFNYDVKVFSFRDENKLWDTIMFILKENIETETINAINVNTDGEKRVHACGRADALRDLHSALLSEREKALEMSKSEII